MAQVVGFLTSAWETWPSSQLGPSFVYFEGFTAGWQLSVSLPHKNISKTLKCQKTGAVFGPSCLYSVFHIGVPGFHTWLSSLLQMHAQLGPRRQMGWWHKWWGSGTGFGTTCGDIRETKQHVEVCPLNFSFWLNTAITAMRKCSLEGRIPKRKTQGWHKS